MAMKEYLIATKEDKKKQHTTILKFYLTENKKKNGTIYGIKITKIGPEKQIIEENLGDISFSRDLVYRLIDILIQEHTREWRIIRPYT